MKKVNKKLAKLAKILNKVIPHDFALEFLSIGNIGSLHIKNTKENIEFIFKDAILRVEMTSNTFAVQTIFSNSALTLSLNNYVLILVKAVHLDIDLFIKKVKEKVSRIKETIKEVENS